MSSKNTESTTVDVAAFLADMQAIASDTSVAVRSKREQGTDTENITALLDEFYASGESQRNVEDSDIIGWTHTRKGENGRPGVPSQSTIDEVYVIVRKLVAADTRALAVQKAGDTILLLNPLAGEDAMQLVADEVRRLTSLRNHNAAVAQDEKRSTKERAAARKRSTVHGNTLNDLLQRIAQNIG